MSKNITELSSIEFTGSLGEAFHRYGDALNELADRWATEIEIAAVDAEAAMGSMKGHLLLFGLDSKIKARRVAARLKRAHDLARSLAERGDAFHASYRKHFTPRT